MSKKFYEANDILNQIEGKEKFTEIDRQYEKLMSEIPNFNKRKDNSIIIYRRGDYIIIKTKKKSYIVINKKKSFKQGHTHTKDFKYSKSLIDLSKQNNGLLDLMLNTFKLYYNYSFESTAKRINSDKKHD